MSIATLVRFACPRLVAITFGLVFATGSSALAQTATVTFAATQANRIPAVGTGPGGAAVYPIPLTVSGLSGPITRITARLQGVSHTFPDDMRVVLMGPTGQSLALMANAGGDVDLLGATLSFEDGAAPLTDAGPMVSGTYAPSVFGAGSAVPAPAPATPHGGTFSVFNGTNPNGVWFLYVFDDASADFGTMSGFSLTITHITGVQPPTGLTVASMVGNFVTLRWTAPGFSDVPTGYLLEGGTTPGGTIATIPTGSAFPVFALNVPSGTFFLRVRMLAGASVSPPSNEIPVFVNVPVPPSPPANLLSVVNGNTLGLAWRNTFVGGAPTGMTLNVTGSANTTIPLGLTEAAVFPVAPGGTYTMSVRAANGGGASGPSNSVTVTLPGACSGAPQPPANFLASKTGSILTLRWDPAAAGAAPTGFIVNVSGTFVGSFPVGGRAISSLVGPGSYTLSVVAANPCGVSTATAPQVITVP